MAVHAGLPELFGDTPVVLREPELLTGYPDVVLVFPRPSPPALPSARFEIEVDDLRLLHHVWAYGVQTFAEIEQALRVQAADIERHAARLVQAELLDLVDDTLVTDSCRFGVTEIIAVEAKMDKWRDALDQACANRWFASQSYVLLPERRFVERAAEAAAALGIGVLVFDGERIRRVLDARRQALPASVGSWLVGEWSLRRTACGHGR